MPKKFSVVLLILLGAAVIVSIGSVKNWALFARPQEKITIAEVARPAFALVYIAQAKGYFRDAGVDVTFLPAKVSFDALDLAVDEKADLASVFELSVIQKHLARKAVSVVASVSNFKKNTGLVALKSRGIQSVADLKGKRIGVMRKTNSDFFLFLLLAGAGIRPDTVTRVDLPPEKMAAALKAGEVDAVAAWTPHLNNARSAVGEDRSVSIYSDLFLQFALLAGTPKAIAQKKTAIAALLGAIARAERYVHTHREETVEIIARRLPDFPKEGVSNLWQDYALAVKLDNVMLDLLNQKANWLSRQDGHGELNLDLRQVIFSDFLKEVYPEAVTIRNVP